MTVAAILRPYQFEVLVKARLAFDKGHSRLLFPLATGLGKTVVFTHLPETFPELAKRGMLVLVHRDELLWQTANTFRRLHPNLSVGIEKSSHTSDPGKDVVIATVQSMARGGSSSKRLRPYIEAGFGGIVCVDEAHHLKEGGSYSAVLAALDLGANKSSGSRRGSSQQLEDENGNGKPLGENRRRLLAGFTATPYRGDGKLLLPFFDAVMPEKDLRWGIRNGYLVDIEAVVVDGVTDLNGVPVRGGEFAAGALEGVVNNELRNASVVRVLRDEAAAGRALVFCAGVAHAQALADKLGKEGIAAAAIHAKTAVEERREVLESFKDGSLRAITNVGVLTEGFDAPECDTIVMCRPVISKPLYMQILGRGTRPAVDISARELDAAARIKLIGASHKKSMKVVDFNENCGRHNVQTMAGTMGLPRGFDWQGESVASIAELMEDAERAGMHGLEDAVSAEELRLQIRRYLLLGGAAAAAASSGAAQPIRPISEHAKGERVRNRLVTMKWVADAEADVGSIRQLRRAVWFTAVEEGSETPLDCYSSRGRDADGEPLHAGAQYLLTASVARDSSWGGPVVIERCRLVLCDRN